MRFVLLRNHAWKSSSRQQGMNLPMSRLPTGRQGQSFIEFALMIILVGIVVLSILLIMGDDLRTLINDLLQTWFPEEGTGLEINSALAILLGLL